MRTAPILSRLGVSRPRNPDLAGLRAVHRAWRARIPYENLDIQLSRPIGLEPDLLIEKFGRLGRVGFCFEMNGALALLLDDLGYDVTLVECGVLRAERGEETWGNHVALLVELDGVSWLADCGIGDAFLEPLPLTEGPHRQGHLVYRLERLDDDTWRVHHHPAGSVASYDLRTAPRVIDDFAAASRRLATDPESAFVRVLLCQHHQDGIEHGLRSRELTTVGPAGRSRRTLVDETEFAQVLRTRFALPDLGADAVHELWRIAGRQHRAWLEIAGRPAG